MFSFFRKKNKPQPPTSPAGPDNLLTPSEADSATPAIATPAETQPLNPSSTSISSPSSIPDAPPHNKDSTESINTVKEPETVQTVPTEPVPPESPPVVRASWLSRLTSGLKKTGKSITQVFTGTQIDENLYEELETALLISDAGTAATQYLLDHVRQKVKETKATDPAAVRNLLQTALTELLTPLESTLQIGEHHPTVMMVAGVNGAGKTTTIGKLTRHLAIANRKVLLAAGDTFRAAAREQLAVWADRNTVEIISQDGADPASVSFDAVTAGRARGADVVIVDTAGRLSTQNHLMDELKKIRRVIGKAMDAAPHEVLLVVDGNTGQNALTQVQTFDAAINLTGLVITKLDGTAKGGIVAAIALWSAEREKAGGKALPVYFIGVGEQVEDLQTFRAHEFAQALLGE